MEHLRKEEGCHQEEEVVVEDLRTKEVEVVEVVLQAKEEVEGEVVDRLHHLEEEVVEAVEVLGVGVDPLLEVGHL